MVFEDVPISSPILEVQFIINLKFQSNNMCQNVDDVSLKDKIGVEDTEIIDIVLPIHIEDKKVVLEEDLIIKVKFVREHIKRQLGKG